MHRGFTIIEVVIAVVILALVGTALIKNGSDGIEFLQRVHKKNEAIDMTLIAANHRNPVFNHLQKPLEDFLQNSYLIDDIDLQKILKNQKFKYLETYPKVEMPVLEGFEEKDSEEVMQENAMPLQVVKISLQGKDIGDYFYVLELNE